MEPYEIALNKFLDRYRKKKWYRGALLCGSFATGNNNKNSDIDCHILSDDSVDWRERGNLNIDGFIIEYFINPPKKIKEYIDEECKELGRSTTNMFVNGKIIDDKYGLVFELKNYADKSRSVTKKYSEYNYKMNCYSIWDSFDELESKYNDGLDIDFQYNIFLMHSYKAYCYNSRVNSVAISKLEKMLFDKNFRKKYGADFEIDKKVENLYKKAFAEKDRDKKYKIANQLKDYLLKLYNFDINNFSLKSKI